MSTVFSLDKIAADFHLGDINKRPFLFLHGNTQNDTCGTGLKNFFKEKGHTVLSYDLPGHGDSPLETKEYCFSDLIDLNHQLLEAFDIRRPILAGHSLGAMIQSGTIPRFQLKDSSLLLCGGYDGNPATAARKQDQEAQAELIDRSLSNYINEGFKLFKRQKKYNYYENRAIEDGILQIINLRYTQPIASKINLETLKGFSARQALAPMKIPTLVLHGEKEDVIPKPIVETMLTAYSNIKAEWYPDSGHCAFYQCPELTESFLNKHYNFLCQL